MVLQSIPVSNKSEDAPKTGSCSLDHTDFETEYLVHFPADHVEHQEFSTFKRQFCRRNLFSYWRSGATVGEVSADETDGIVLQNASDVALIREIAHFEGHKLCDADLGRRCLLPYNMTAKWDAQSQKGTFTIKLYLRTDTVPDDQMGSASFSRLLAVWFGMAPFSLESLGGFRLADVSEAIPPHPRRSIAVPPYQLKETEVQRHSENIKEKSRQAVDAYNATVELRKLEFSLQSSRPGNILGGSIQTDIGMEAALKRYFSEVLIEDVVLCSPHGNHWTDSYFGIVDPHRFIRKRWTKLLPEHESRHGLSYLRKDDIPLAFVNLKRSCADTCSAIRSMKSILDHCENVGHAEIPYFEGLSVELLQFQKQAVQWCYERETVEGGIQRLWTPKLPQVAEPSKHVYFNPILDSMSDKAPRLVRGGIIAAEMGLGKTVVSLSLVLVNPAPVLPVSGSPVSSLNTLKGSSNARWDKLLFARTSVDNKKRGSILSRGTLVICHVSLVGQWIEEARSKLKDPGLLYSYHGSGRKRDPFKLARNAIVVTTYETLASDATYHAQKSSSVKYCPPLEQIRWWRIVCDESHKLKDPNTRSSKAVMSLVADHKWLVSGTPVNTSLNDLKNQLQFLGLEHVEAMFKKFSSLMEHSSDPGAGRRRYKSNYKMFPFFFLMRAVLLRHAQNQKYRGTDTTLMSLPPKTERSIHVRFSKRDKAEYNKLEATARAFYADFRGSNSNPGKHYLKLTQKLIPMRVACAGGKIPLGTLEEIETGENTLHEEDKVGKSLVKKKVRYSTFAIESKIDCLITELKAARENDPSSKSLVFSMFQSSLEYLQEQLPKVGFQFRTLRGDMSMSARAKALQEFQQDPPTTIFLLSTRASACGINLTQANRVFLLEPGFNPALEAQCIGRVHRLGQKRPVEIVRLIMNDSVETRMVQMLKDKYGGDKSDDNNDEVSPSKKFSNTCNSMVGNVHTEKATILTREFDILFGYNSAENTVVNNRATAMPDSVMSESGPSFGQGEAQDGDI